MRGSLPEILVRLVTTVASAGRRARWWAPAVLFVLVSCSRGPDYPPLPQVQHSAHRSEAAIREAYHFVAAHPEVVQYVPCFCGCERHGHTSVGDCFVKARSRHGVEWNDHGMT